jgi:Flp pilus assembly protein TadD
VCSADAETRCRLFSAGLALLWACHPLQTGAVTYVVQRAESLAGLFYLLTLYGFLRGAGEPVLVPAHAGRTGRVRWYSLAALACLAGVATKETVVTAPVLVLLLDRALLAGSFAAAWKARWPFYCALAASWALLGLLVAGNSARGGSAGFAAAIDVPTYLLTQCRALPHYLSLVVWPSGLVFDHGVETVRTAAEVLPQILFLVVLGATALGLLFRNHIVGTLLAGFFLLLAPSSSFVPVATQTVAEHRMYLPLAAVLGAGFVLGGMALRSGATSRRPVWAPVLAIGLFAAALGTTTIARNRTFRSGLSLWQDTVARCPANARAHHNLGLELMRAGQTDAAAGEFRAAIALQPNHAFARAWLGYSLLAQEQPTEAERHLRAAVAADVAYGFAWVQLGNALVQLGRDDEAAQAYSSAVRLAPGDADAHFGLAVVFAQQRRIDSALVEFQRVIELDPARIEARANLGNCLLVSGRPREAITAYEEVLRIRPGEPTALRNLALAREALGE